MARTDFLERKDTPVRPRIAKHKGLLTDYDTDTAYVQAFYTLFANLRFHQEREQTGQTHTPATPVHTLLVTSASPSQNQATVAANLAIVAARSGAETILVDTHLRAPTLQGLFDLTQDTGLSDLLEEGEITPAKIATRLQPVFVAGLRVLTSGPVPAQGSALLLSPHLTSFVAGLRDLLATSGKPAGVVVFHSAPALSGADASLIADLSDQAVLTVIMGQTTRTQVKLAQEQLEQARTKLTGVVLLH